jgi:acyl-CoA synthetase (AMP-forming)/AMP-acid ligase II
VPQGEHGEIFVRSETTMSGYLNQPELTARTVVDGWIRTGDIARLDNEGYMFLASRRSEIIIRGGENVYPGEIEAVLADQPGVALASVVGMADAHWGEIIVAVVTPAHGVDEPDVHALRQACVTRLATYKVPQHIIVASVLPTTGMGKVDRPKVRELAVDALARNMKSVDISDNSW